MSQFPKAKPSTSARQPRGPKPLRTHAIHGDTVDWDGVAVCSDCGFRADHRVHAVEVPAEATAIDARILGEVANE